MIMADRMQTRSGPRAWIGGVCADFARRTGLPVWMWRVGAVFLLLCHALVALLLYGFLVMLHARKVERYADNGPILNGMEAVRMAREEKLRRAFQDLERFR